tara:strand:+ start:1616 stop:1783 length:168 start_codon:yes stop_codon:yes gene_type:complete
VNIDFLPIDIFLFLGYSDGHCFQAAGEEIDVVDNAGYTPLHYAIRSSASLETIKV